MELPLFTEQQAGDTYYLSPMTVNNLGIVDHAHNYPKGTVSKQMHCHIYTDAIGKNGANNVTSLIMKTLRGMNILHTDEQGGELNIIFDNWTGQNKKQHGVEATSMASTAGVFLGDQLYFSSRWSHEECGRPPLQLFEA